MSVTPNHSENQIQQNTIALLKEMGWKYIDNQNEIHNYRENTNQD